MTFALRRARALLTALFCAPLFCGPAQAATVTFLSSPDHRLPGFDVSYHLHYTAAPSRAQSRQTPASKSSAFIWPARLTAQPAPPLPRVTTGPQKRMRLNLPPGLRHPDSRFLAHIWDRLIFQDGRVYILVDRSEQTQNQGGGQETPAAVPLPGTGFGLLSALVLLRLSARKGVFKTRGLA